MIIRPRPGLLAILFTLRGSILPQVAPKVLGIALVFCLVTAAERQWPGHFPEAVGVGPFTLIGLALSIFLSFHNGACYEAAILDAVGEAPPSAPKPDGYVLRGPVPAAASFSATSGATWP